MDSPSDTAQTDSTLTLLKAPRFAPLFATLFLGAFNDNVFKNALMIYITFKAGAGVQAQSATLVPLAAGVFILPYFLFSATAGQLADKLEKSSLIRKVKVAEIGIMGLAAAGFWLSDVWVLIGILFLMGAQSALFGPLKYAILPQLLSASELTSGNGLVQMGTFLAILMGTMLGGFVVAVEETGTTLTSLIVIALAIVGWLASRGIPRAEPADSQLRINWNIAAHTLRMMGYAREDRVVFACVLGIAWFWFVGATFLQLLPTFTRDVLGGAAAVATVISTAFAVGIGIGSILCAKLSRGRIEIGVVPVGALGLSVFSIGVYLLTSGMPAESGSNVTLNLTEFLALAANWWVFLDLVLVAVCGGLFIVPLFTLVQSRAPVNRRAQVIAASNIFNALFMVLSAVITVVLLAAGRSAGEIIMLMGIASAVMTGGLFVFEPDFVKRFFAWSGLKKPS